MNRFIGCISVNQFKKLSPTDRGFRNGNLNTYIKYLSISVFCMYSDGRLNLCIVLFRD